MIIFLATALTTLTATLSTSWKERSKGEYCKIGCYSRSELWTGNTSWKRSGHFTNEPLLAFNRVFDQLQLCHICRQDERMLSLGKCIMIRRHNNSIHAVLGPDTRVIDQTQSVVKYLRPIKCWTLQFHQIVFLYFKWNHVRSFSPHPDYQDILEE